MISLESRAEEVTRLLGWADPLLESSELDKMSSFHFRCALVEIVNNCIQHGYGFEAGHAVEVRLDLDHQGVSATVRDHGPAFEPPASDAPSELMGESGRGYEIIRAWVDQLEFDRVDGWNVCRFTRLKSSD